MDGDAIVDSKCERNRKNSYDKLNNCRFFISPQLHTIYYELQQHGEQ